MGVAAGTRTAAGKKVRARPAPALVLPLTPRTLGLVMMAGAMMGSRGLRPRARTALVWEERERERGAEIE